MIRDGLTGNLMPSPSVGGGLEPIAEITCSDRGALPRGFAGVIEKLKMVAGETLWEQKKLRLFISHTSAHKVEVSAQKIGLAALGIHAFVAHEDIEPSLEWQAVIEEALATCDALLAWLTPDFPESSWTDQEVGFCVARTILIIPVRAGLNPFGFIAKYQALQSANRQPFEVSTEIAATIAKNGNTAPRYVEPAAVAFASAGTFDMARATFRILSLLPADGWTEEALRTVEQAPSANNQIEEGIYERRKLPDLVREFVDTRRSRLATAPSSVSGGADLATIDCRAEVQRINDVLTANDRVFRQNRTVWLYVKNLGPTAEFSVRLWNVQGLPQEWGLSYAVRHVSWEGARTTRPEIDGYGGERGVKVANVSLDPLAFWFYTTDSGVEQYGPQLLLSDLFPTFVGHNVIFEVEVVNHTTGEKLLKTAYVLIPPDGDPRMTLRDSVLGAR